MGADKPMVKNARSKATLGMCADGCSCCNVPRVRRKPIKAAKHREKRAWRLEENAPR